MRWEEAFRGVGLFPILGSEEGVFGLGLPRITGGWGSS